MDQYRYYLKHLIKDYEQLHDDAYHDLYEFPDIILCI